MNIQAEDCAHKWCYDQDTIKLHNQVPSCMDTLDSYSKDHGFTSMEVGKKSSSKTLT